MGEILTNLSIDCLSYFHLRFLDLRKLVFSQAWGSSISLLTTLYIMKRTNGRHGQSGKEQRFSGWNMLESILFLSVIANNRCWNPIIDTPCLSRLIRDLINCTFWSPPFLRGSLVAQADGSCTSEDCEVSLRQLRAEKLKAIEKEAHVLGVGAFPLFGHKWVFGLAFSWWTTGIYVWYYDFWYTIYRIFMHVYITHVWIIREYTWCMNEFICVVWMHNLGTLPGYTLRTAGRVCGGKMNRGLDKWAPDMIRWFNLLKFRTYSWYHSYVLPICPNQICSHQYQIWICKSCESQESAGV